MSFIDTSIRNPVNLGLPTAQNSNSDKLRPIGAIVGGVLGGLAGLLLIVGLMLGLLRRRRRHISTSKDKTKPTPFVEPSHSSPFVLEKRERDPLTRRQIPIFARSHFRDSSLTAVGGPSETLPPASYHIARLREEELLGIRSEIEELRRFMQSTHIEPASSDLGAPPDYSSSRGDS